MACKSLLNSWMPRRCVWPSELRNGGNSTMKTTPACMLALVLTATTLPAAELRIGGATTSITPDQPVALDGHRNLRISSKIESPVTATALAWESRDGDKVL